MKRVSQQGYRQVVKATSHFGGGQAFNMLASREKVNKTLRLLNEF